MIGRLASGVFAFSAIAAAIVACDTGSVLPQQDEGSFAKKPHPPSCKVEDCVTGLAPDLEHGTIAESICSCTEVDFWQLFDECSAQGGTVVSAGSCGTQTPSCDATTLNCVIPKPQTPHIVASTCDCGDESAFWEFFGQCQGLGGEVTTVFPSGHEVSCTP